VDAVAEVRDLERCIGDLTSLLALRTLLSEHSSAHVVGTLLDALFGMLRLEFAYARLSDGVADVPAEFLRVAPAPEGVVRPEGVGAVLAPACRAVTAPARMPNPVGEGEVAIVPIPLGIEEEAGILVTGSRREDFPTGIEMLLLRVAANQAAIWLCEARLLAERRRNEKALERRVAERTRELEAANEQLRLEIHERHRAEAHLVELKDELAADLSAVTRLHELGGRLLASSELQSLLDEVLHATIALQNADFGNVQLYDRQSRTLEIVAQRGFREDFLEYFGRVHEGRAGCGRALQRSERVVIEDVETDPGFEPHRSIAAAAGFRGVQSTPMFGRDGEPLGMLSTHFRRPHRPSDRELRLTDLYARHAAEMIERRRSEQALRQSAEQFRLLTEAIPHHVWGARADGVLAYCNQQWRDYSGLTLRQAQRQGWIAFLHPDDVDKATTAVREAEALGKSYEIEGRLRGASGGYRRFIVRAVPVCDGRGHITQWFGTNTDVEERRQAAEALRETQTELAHVARLTMMGELAASLAHELSQPLAAVVSNASACLRWLHHDPPNVDEARLVARRAIRDATRASAVIAHTRALVTKASVEKVLLDVTEVIHEVLLLVGREVLKHGAVVLTSLAADLPPVLGARVELQQALLNLIMNGLEAMANVSDRRRELAISAQRAEVHGSPAVLVAVQDAGVGVAREQLDRLFDTFYTTKPHGLGLGLSITRSIVTGHGGRLWATGNTGPGATFRFLLPAMTAPAT
jgi:PAS domain S-box-containing protein